ncbi:carboxypeptidase regulatory-like domain-containing protein, partial [Parabacteroides sp. OttesenSCG-928-J18]|nr:carboxypeptidase regulatory-like domain-containing protein [Parabacteroides sp. OttesenSCG-928-J18]
LKNMPPAHFTWESTDPADDFKGLIQIVNEISLGKMEIEVECLNKRLAEVQGLDPETGRWPWFHLDGPMIGYAVQGPADCEDYRQFARLHQAGIDAAYRDIPGLDIEDIDFIYTIVPINAFGHRAGLQGGGGLDTSFSFNDQALPQRESEFRHEPGVKTREGRVVGSGVFGIKNLWSRGDPRHAVSISMHEFLHGMGMFDDYYYGWMPWLDGKSVNSAVNYRNTGESTVGQKFGRDTQDLTAWRKFRTGWIPDNEVKVILPGEKEIVTVRALSSYPDDGGSYTDDPAIDTRMVVIPKEWRTRDTYGLLWDNGWNPQKGNYNWYDWFTNPWVGGETHAIKSFPTFYALEVRKPLGADNTMNGDNSGVVINMIANPTWETGHGAGGFKLCTGNSGLKEGDVWQDPNLGLRVRVLESNEFYDKIEIEYTGVATTTVNEAFPGPAKHVYQGVLTASDNYVQPDDLFTVDFDIFTLGTSAVNDIQSPATEPTPAAPYNNGVIRVATPLGVPGGVAGYRMIVRFDAAHIEYVSTHNSNDFTYEIDTADASKGRLTITTSGDRMVNKDTILSLKFRAKTDAAAGEHAIDATITDVTLFNWRGQVLKAGDPGFDGVGTIKDAAGKVSTDPLADLYKYYVKDNILCYYDYTDYEPAIFSRGGTVYVGNAPRYTVSGRIVCDTPGPAPGSFIGVESEVTLFNSAGQVVTKVKSDWNGNYHIPGVPAGTGYYVTAEKSSYFPGEGSAFAVTNTDIITETIQLHRLTYKVSGTVYGGEKSDGSDATPLAGVDVYILNIGNAYKILGGPYKTDAQGRYEIDARVESRNKPFAAVAVDVSGTGFGHHIRVKDARAGELYLNLGRNYGLDPNDRVYPANKAVYGVGGGYNFLLASNVTDRDITLSKWQEVHLRTGTKSTEISYQLKTLDGVPVGDPLQSVGTDDGDDILRDVPAGGPYYVEVSRPGYMSACTMPFSVNTTRVFLRNAFASNTLDLVEKNHTENITGTVTDAKTGRPLAGVAITVVPYNAGFGKGVPVYSDKNGTFSYPDIPGEKDIVFSKKGYKDHVLNVRSGAPTGLSIKLNP